jgi:hypothetical protein
MAVTHEVFIYIPASFNELIEFGEIERNQGSTLTVVQLPGAANINNTIFI